MIIDADKFLTYLIFSKHIDGLTCGEVKEAIEMCKTDVFDKIREDIKHTADEEQKHDEKWAIGLRYAVKIVDKYKEENEGYKSTYQQGHSDDMCGFRKKPSRDMKEIEEVINCDADAETKCKMIYNILTSKPHYFEEPQKRSEKE